MKLIGLTGGIASGKSTAADFFARLKVPVISTDKLAHELTMHDARTKAEIVKAFGEEILNNNKIDKQKLKSIVFVDSEKKAELESILHPGVKQLMDEKIKHLTTPYAIVEVPLLFEAGWDKFMDRVLLLTAPINVKRKRLLQRDNMDSRLVRTIIKSQMNDAEKQKLADDIIDNSESLEKLKDNVLYLHHKYLQM